MIREPALGQVSRVEFSTPSKAQASMSQMPPTLGLLERSMDAIPIERIVHNEQMLKLLRRLSGETLFKLARFPLSKCEAERARDLTISLMEAGVGKRKQVFHDRRLEFELWGLKFRNPVGLAAGFDKDARTLKVLSSQGFGIIEVGTVTPRAQLGNPKPRMFRVPNEWAVVNKFGFNNDGIERFCERLARFSETEDRGKIILGANIGRNKDSQDAYEDYMICARRLNKLADYVCVNISSPNTPNLRDLHARNHLSKLISGVKVNLAHNDRRDVPLVLKISPDLDDSQLADVAAVSMEEEVDGIVVGNTTVTRPMHYSGVYAEKEGGGLSGRPLLDLSNEVLSKMYRLVDSKVTLIGCGGISSGQDALSKIEGGATFVQLYTAWAYAGPPLIDEIGQVIITKMENANISYLTGLLSTTTAMSVPYSGPLPA